MDRIRKFLQGYNRVGTTDPPETFLDSAPYPRCLVLGCVEESTRVNDRYLYRLCKHHMNMAKHGQYIMHICLHGGCQNEIVNSFNPFCPVHGGNAQTL
jgi:hypothetical protein